MTRIRLNPQDRHRQMVEAGVVLAGKYGIKALTRVAIANETGTTDGLVNRYFGTRAGLRSAIIAEGVKRKDVRIVAFAMREGFTVHDAPRQLRRDAARLVEKLT